MQAPPVPPERCILILGGDNVGKSTLTFRYVLNVFVDPKDRDPTIEDVYRKRANIDGVEHMLSIQDTAPYDEYNSLDGHILRADVILYLMSVDTTHYWESNDLESVIRRVRVMKNLTKDAPLPAFFVATKCDQPRARSREELVALAMHHRFQGYYEISSKTPTNVDELFTDAVRFAAAKVVSKETGDVKRELERLSGVTGLLPWNWSKKARWNTALSGLEFIASGKREAQVMQVVDENVDEVRFPEPEMKRAPVSFYTDLRQLIEQKDGIALSDVSLVGSDGTDEIRAHKIVLCLRSDVLREMVAKADTSTVRVEGVSYAALKQVVHFLYADQLAPAACEEIAQLKEIGAAGHMLRLPDLVVESQRHAMARAIADSAAVERQMRPALTEKSITKLSDVKFVVGGRSFRLHRALLWARSAWFRALLDEKWQGGRRRTKIEVRSLTATVFAIVVEYLYTGRASIGPEDAFDVLSAATMLALPRLVQLAELALQPVIDGGNAVPLYLAAVAHDAKQLVAMCEYWMATDLAQTTSNEQWGEVGAEVRARVAAEHRRLQEARAAKREEISLSARMPCLLAPYLIAKP